ncbi:MULTISPECIES: hydantoinase/oxoprolinase family protein [unclassified Mesorhizobium]|uniref:hydantoinase/oxoprolinase N-terminal domain-containing protein n=1 Tax=unclassified Mesorhizobium TaxID=325217 RepID=UPI00112C5630|nr:MULTISPECIES: hydantoinase/oxoprolinase family protein [unclassified Mesorhizobium]TPN57385.1 hydantoinase/oxoprolinase family protein [Mesorhizobium sp. B1-1-7]TPN57669.1 hydantoinase/oxoprolinase family protein [Mesorhizobium sp. B1-1-9]
MNGHAQEPSPLCLGIDTGGTYTDAVLWSEFTGIVAKAKSLTTRHDLAEGIGGAVDAVLSEAAIEPGAIKLVSMSTTLATNALVEGQGGRVALVMIGFAEADLARNGLSKALGSDPVIFCPGGHDVHGDPRQLVLDALVAALPSLASTVSGVAVASYFAVRNPEHEVAVRDVIRERTGLPVTCSHELSSKLGGPRRALTTLLNARLISMIDRLVDATEGFLARRGIVAPLMVVRGDGALVTAEFARARPIETILSGPAASLVGARYMTGIDDAVVSDIGGTTTDIAVLDGGRLRLDSEGATVGAMRTMVEAVAMRTFGLGGDSEVSLHERSLTSTIVLGPRRLVPLALAAVKHGHAIYKVLKRQLLSPNTSRLDGRFALRTGVPERLAAGLTVTEARLYADISAIPAALDRLLVSTSQVATLNRLVARGLVHIAGFTPSDAAHVLGRQGNWDPVAARLGAELFSRKRDGQGHQVAKDAETFSEMVLAAVTRRSAEALLETVFAEDGLDGGVSVANPLVQRAIGRRGGMARLSIALDRPVIGLGASATLHYAGLPQLIGNDCSIAEHADVANALGAVVGQVRMSAEARVSQPEIGLFRLNSGERLDDYDTEDEAMAAAEAHIFALAAGLAERAGTDQARIEIARDIRVATIEGERTFVEAIVVATATGRPRIAS